MQHQLRQRLGVAAVQERTTFVSELVQSGMARARILAAFRERFGDTATRTVDSYLRRAREAFIVSAVAPPAPGEQRARERETFLAELAADVAAAKKADAWPAVAQLRKLEADVRGLRVLAPAGPTTNVTNNVAVVVSPEVREHRRRLLRRVLEEPAFEPDEGSEGSEPA
ncbi:MAG TPA: hypothetical protein VMI54_03830 [Polyangiaceae bacterium]|nr:hypothetical protein [Polyangiaceae bacterium]